MEDVNKLKFLLRYLLEKLKEVPVACDKLPIEQ